MAKKERKNQKFDRKRTRSPAHKRYNFARKDRINKLRKLRAHCAAHPDDQRNASALKMLSVGILAEAVGPAATFPLKPYTHDKHKPDGINDLDLEYRKHTITHGPKRADGKRKKTIVLLEPCATGPLYWVESERKVLDVSPDLEAATFVYDKCRHSVSLVERGGDITSVLKNKRAVPLMVGKAFEKAFAG